MRREGREWGQSEKGRDRGGGNVCGRRWNKGELGKRGVGISNRAWELQSRTGCTARVGVGGSRESGNGQGKRSQEAKAAACVRAWVGVGVRVGSEEWV